MRRGRRSGLYTIVAVHSTARGPSLGGCRMWGYADSRDAVADALRLSRAMTFKAAVADLPQGGGKGVIMRPLGEPAAAGRAPPRRAAGLRRHRRDPRRPLPDRRGRRDVRRRHDGDRGAHLARHRPRRRARRLRRPQPVDRARRPGGDPRSPASASGARATSPSARSRSSGSAASAGRSPAASPPPARGSSSRTSTRASARSPTSSAPSGPIRTPRSAPRSTCWRRARSARCSTPSPSPRCAAARSRAPPTTSSRPRTVAERLIERDILWAPDFVANAGGIINISVELEPEGYAPERAEGRVRAIGDTLRTIFDDADAAGTTPLAAAMALAYRRLAEASAPPPAASLGAPPA